MYSIFGKDLKTGESIPDELEKGYVDWILEKYQRSNYEKQDELISKITKEFNVKRYIYEISNNRSVETMKEIFAIDISEAQQDELIRLEGENITDKERWVSEVKITELISSLYKSKPNLDVVVMHPEINGSKEEKLR